MTARVDFVWADDCPNVRAARANLMRAFAEAQMPARWQEWRADEATCPSHLRHLGSPAIVVDGRDIAGYDPAAGPGCRIYPGTDGGQTGVPPVALIARALRACDGSTSTASSPKTAEGHGSLRWKRMAGVAPSVAVALLPKVACPACWPAYAGALSALGVTFLIDTRYLLALTSAFLAIALVFLGFRADRRWGYGPLALGVLASAALLVGKFWYESDAAMYVGVALLMIASLWNAWPRPLPDTRSAACCLVRPADAVGAMPRTPACCGPDTEGENG